MAAATTASKVRKHVAQHELRQSLSQALPAGYGSSPETASAENSVLSETTAIPAATARSLARTLWYFLLRNGAAVVFLIKEWRIRRGGGRAILNRPTIRKCSSCGISY